MIGSVVSDSARIEDGKGFATILLSKAAGVADTVTKIREGVIRNISVGYWIHKVVKTEADDVTVARWDVVDWEPLEVSAVPIPADPGAQIRSETKDGDAKPALRSCTLITKDPPAVGPKHRNKTPMARKPTNTAEPRAAKAAEAAEAEKKRLEALAAVKRDADGDDMSDEENAADDSDEENAADDTDDKRDEEDADGENAADDSDDDDTEDKKDDERAAPGKRLTTAEVRKAAEAAVRADRIRGAKIREIAAQFGFPKLGERHANDETSVRKFKDMVLERLADRQKKRGNTTFGASGSRDLEVDAPTAKARDFDKGAAEARALLGKK